MKCAGGVCPDLPTNEEPVDSLGEEGAAAGEDPEAETETEAPEGDVEAGAPEEGDGEAGAPEEGDGEAERGRYCYLLIIINHKNR
jgi:hypothetical protein